MNLPQRKKSAEEIAKLRESLGIVGSPPVEEDLPVEALTLESPAELDPSIFEPVSAIERTQEITCVEEILTTVPTTFTEPKLVRSLRRSERTAVLTVEKSVSEYPLDQRSALPVPSPLPSPSGPKIVRSLRKSEQGPLSAVHLPLLDSTLPIHRHSDEQLNRIRRHEALARPEPPPHPLSLMAHPVLIIPGYLCAIAGAAWPYFYDVEKRGMAVTTGCVLVALAIAAFIFFKKPQSRHHAAFIAVVSLFVTIFAALYYFPQLQHGT